MNIFLISKVTKKQTLLNQSESDIQPGPSNHNSSK